MLADSRPPPTSTKCAARLKVGGSLSGRRPPGIVMMYPKGLQDYASRGIAMASSMLPRRPSFNGLADGEKLVVSIERGKSLVIRLLGCGESEDGHAKLFFELNGQPRVITGGSGAARADARPLAEGNPTTGRRAADAGHGQQHRCKGWVDGTRGDTLETCLEDEDELAIRAERDAGRRKAVM